MNKLELKHLTPYSDKALKGEWIDINGKGWLHDLLGLDTRSNQVLLMTYDGNVNWYPVEQFKPHFRPLSDLTKEIEHNGDRFIPLGVLHYRAIRTPTGRKSKAQYHTYESQGYIGTMAKNAAMNGVGVHLSEIGLNKYSVMRKLFEWHFDVFGLIIEGLAIKHGE